MANLWVRIALYTGWALLVAATLQSQAPAASLGLAQLFNLALYASFCLGIPLLERALKNARDEAYLYYLGVSGLRMLGYMASLGLAVFTLPAMRNRAMILLLTVGFVGYTVVEVTAFVRKLRKIFKNTP